jgi:hypothetical protein
MMGWVKAALTAACVMGVWAGDGTAQSTAALAGGDVDHEPRLAPSVEVHPSVGSIDVDGTLEDPGWRDATRVSSFTEFSPQELRAAETPTEAWLTFDDAYLYVAFRVTDDPSAIRATLRDRDQVMGDDWVAVLLDTYGNNEWAYLIGSNAIGVQTDSRVNVDGHGDDSLDLIFEAEGRITDTGYQVEMAIPFSSLRFPDTPEQTWRLNLYRQHPRDARRQYTWAAIRQDAGPFLSQSGTLTGIAGVEPGGRLDVLPSVVASRYSGLTEGDDPSSFAGQDPQAEVALSVRYPLRAGWTLEGAVNPDFSQVESDAAQIDVNTTFALFYPERRPFFQEGSDLFQTWINQFYTRSINDPSVAAKLVGRQGRWSFAWAGAVDEHSPVILPFEERSAIFQNGRSVSNVLRARRALGDVSYLGMLVTDRRMDAGGAGTTLGADATLSLSPKWRADIQLVASRIREPNEAGESADLDWTFDGGRHTAGFDSESFWGLAHFLGVRRNARRWNASVAFVGASPTFRADNGFQTRNDYHVVDAYSGWTFYPDRFFVDQASVDFSAGTSWNSARETTRRSFRQGLRLSMKGQTEVFFDLMFRDERWRDVFFQGIGSWVVGASTAFSDLLRFGAHASGGKGIARNEDPPYVGEPFSLGVNATLKPTQRLVFQPSLSYARMLDPEGNEAYSGYVARARLNYQFSRSLFVRLVTQYNDFSDRLDVEPLLTYRLNAFSMVYLGSTHGFGRFDDPFGMEPTERQYFFKVQYLWRP